MAITKGAKKAIRTSARKYVFNLRRKVTLHDTVKSFKEHVHKKEYTKAQTLLPQVYQAIDKAAKRNVITKNTANRKKSRLAATLPRS
jgi:small subunit ribosomal protein S20